MSAADALRQTASQNVQNAFLGHVTVVTGVQPGLTVRMNAHRLSGLLLALIAQHIANTGLADLADFAVTQFLIGVRIADADIDCRHRHTNAAVHHREQRHRHREVGTALTHTVARAECEITAASAEKRLYLSILAVIERLCAGTRSQEEAHIIVRRDALAVHQDIVHHRNRRAEIRLNTHKLQIKILHAAERIQNQQLASGQREQHHGYGHCDQCRRQHEVQPLLLRMCRRSVECHLINNADHIFCGMNDQLGNAGRTAGICAINRTGRISRSRNLTGVVLTQRKELLPSQIVRITCSLLRIHAAEIVRYMLRNAFLLCIGIRRDRYHALCEAALRRGALLPDD